MDMVLIGLDNLVDQVEDQVVITQVIMDQELLDKVMVEEQLMLDLMHLQVVVVEQERLVGLVVLMVQIGKHGLIPENNRRLMCLSMFWHFLDVVWIGVFTFVYLIGVL